MYRYVNHAPRTSVDCNADTKLLEHAGEYTIALFARADIPVGTEIR